MTAEETVLERDVLGAFCRHTHVALAGADTGPLAGLTFGLKDIFDVAGHRTGFGSPDWLRTHAPAERSWSGLARLLDAGATMVGRTHTEELAFSLTGENAHYGSPVNPAAPGRVPGGSSSGSAAAVAGGLVDFAIGSDTGGSVRGPASFCGIYGIRPTHGRIALDGACPLAPSFDTCGWFARDATLLARVGEVLLGESIPEVPAAATVLVATDAMAQLLPGARETIGAALPGVFSALGAPVQEVILAPEGLGDWFATFRDLQYAEIWEAHGEWARAIRPTFGPQVGSRMTLVEAACGSPDPAVQARHASLMALRQRERQRIRAHLDALLPPGTVMLLPTMPDIAPVCGASPADTVIFRERALGLLCAAGLGGLPQLSIPVATVDGCPVGLSLLGGRGTDAWLLALARLMRNL